MATICDLYKLLQNPLRLEMLRQIYTARDGFNVGFLVDALRDAGIGQSGVSQYLKQLMSVGVISRLRSGKFVNYYARHSENPSIDIATSAIIKRLSEGGSRDFAYVFDVMMNPFRAFVVSLLSRRQSVSAVDICEKTGHFLKYLKRDLQPAVDAGLINVSDSDVAVTSYSFVEPRDPLVSKLISLVPSDHIL